MNNQRITLSTPTDVITAAAWLMGFHPIDSLLVLGFGGSTPTARIDFPHNGEALIAAAEELGAAYRRNPGGAALILAYTDDAVAAFDAITAVTAMLDGLVDVTQALVVDGNRWLSTSGGAGTLDPDRVALVAAEMVALGHTPPKPSRASLANDLAPIDTTPIENQIPNVTADRLTVDWVTARVEEFHRDGHRLNDADAAALLTALTDNSAFDAVILAHSTANAHSHTALWSDLTRRAPEDLRGNVASLLALAAWLTGQGALAWVALDQGTKRLLGECIAQLLTAAAPPSVWDTIRLGITDD